MAVPLILSNVPNANPYVQYVATNGQTVFPYPFPITQDSDLIVVANGVTLNTDTGYTLSGQGNPTGGNATFTLGRTAGDIITLYRNIAIARISQISQNSGFSSTTFNNEFNNFYLIAQQLQASIAQCLQIPNTNNPAPTTTLLPANYANKYLSFDANGNPTPAVLTPSGTLTQATIAGLLQPQTGAEAAAGVTPTYYFYAPGDVRRYGALGNGSTDDSAALQRAAAVLNATANGNGPPQMLLTGFHPINGTLTITQAGVAVVGLTSSQSTCGLMQTGNVDTLIFQNATPANGIRNCAIRDFTIMSNSATPTAGRGLVCNYCQNFQASNIQVVTCWQGVNILGGYAHNWVNTLIFGAAGWTTRQAGTYCMRIDIGPGNSVPSEMTFANFDWKGVTVGGVNTLDQGIIINCGDGFFFSNGHVGFANTASMSLTTTAAPAFVDAVEFNNVYFDGGFGSGASGYGVQIFGTAGPAITNVKFNSCNFKNHFAHGANISASNCARVRFTDCIFENNGLWGVIFGAQSDVSVEGCTFYNNNTANGGAAAITAVGLNRYRFQNNLIYGNNYGATGFNLAAGINVDATSTGGSVTGNQFANCTTPMSVASPLTTFAGNRLLGAVPSVVAAAALPATMWGFDYVQVTGNTAITSFAGANIAGQEMTLAFTGTPTVTRGGNILLTSGGGNMVATAGSTLRVANDGTGWREVARAVA